MIRIADGSKVVDGDAWHALQHFGDAVVRKLPRLVRDDGVDDLAGVCLDFLRRFQSGAPCRYDDGLDCALVLRLRKGRSDKHGDRKHGRSAKQQVA